MHTAHSVTYVDICIYSILYVERRCWLQRVIHLHEEHRLNQVCIQFAAAYDFKMLFFSGSLCF